MGWGIIGPVPEQSEQESIDDPSNRIVTWEFSASEPGSHAFIVENRSKEVISPVAVKKMFEADFSERNAEARGFSQEDRIFMTIVEEGNSRCQDGLYEMPLPLKEQNLQLLSN